MRCGNEYLVIATLKLSNPIGNVRVYKRPLPKPPLLHRKHRLQLRLRRSDDENVDVRIHARSLPPSPRPVKRRRRPQ